MSDWRDPATYGIYPGNQRTPHLRQPQLNR